MKSISALEAVDQTWGRTANLARVQRREHRRACIAFAIFVLAPLLTIVVSVYG